MNKIMYWVAAILLLALTACGDGIADDTADITSQDLSAEACSLVKDYLYSQQFAIEYGAPKGIYESKYRDHAIPTVSSTDIADIQLSYIKKQRDSFAAIEYYLTDANVSDRAGDHYTVSIKEEANVLPFDSELSYIQVTTWKFTVYCTSERQNITSVELCSQETNDSEDIFHPTLEKMIENRATQYLIDFSDACNSILGIDFDDALVFYFIPESEIIEKERDRLAQMKSKGLYTEVVFVDDTHVEWTDGESYKVFVSFIERSSVVESDEWTEDKSNWLITVSKAGFFITDVVRI